MFDYIFVAGGEQEPQNGLMLAMAKDYAQKGYDNIRFYTCPGYHEWDTWRNAAYNMLQELFA